MRRAFRDRATLVARVQERNARVCFWLVLVALRERARGGCGPCAKACDSGDATLVVGPLRAALLGAPKVRRLPGLRWARGGGGGGATRWEIRSFHNVCSARGHVDVARALSGAPEATAPSPATWMICLGSPLLQFRGRLREPEGTRCESPDDVRWFPGAQGQGARLAALCGRAPSPLRRVCSPAAQRALSAAPLPLRRASTRSPVPARGWAGGVDEGEGGGRAHIGSARYTGGRTTPSGARARAVRTQSTACCSRSVDSGSPQPARTQTMSRALWIREFFESPSAQARVRNPNVSGLSRPGQNRCQFAEGPCSGRAFFLASAVGISRSC